MWLDKSDSSGGGGGGGGEGGGGGGDCQNWEWKRYDIRRYMVEVENMLYYFAQMKIHGYRLKVLQYN
jgi:hypothetical protein